MSDNSVTRTDILKGISEEGLTKKQISAVISQYEISIQEAIKAGKEVRLNNFITLKPAHRPARAGRNPKTGEVVQIATSNNVQLKISKVLKDFLNP